MEVLVPTILFFISGKRTSLGLGRRTRGRMGRKIRTSLSNREAVLEIRRCWERQMALTHPGERGGWVREPGKPPPSPRPTDECEGPEMVSSWKERGKVVQVVGQESGPGPGGGGNEEEPSCPGWQVREGLARSVGRGARWGGARQGGERDSCSPHSACNCDHPCLCICVPQPCAGDIHTAWTAPA